VQAGDAKTLRVLLIRHMRNDPDDAVSRWLSNNGYQLIKANPAQQLALPERISDVDATVVYGGAQSVNDTSLDYLELEREWLRECLDVGQPIFAICLGAQLLAQVLGENVYSLSDQRKEIGWTKISPVDGSPAGLLDAPQHFFQWHGEGFNVPPSARLFAAGEVFPDQGYVLGEKIIATQFHPEIDTDIIRLWNSEAGHEIELCPLPSAQTAQQLVDAQRYLPAAATWLDRTLSNWSSHISASSDR